MSGDMGSNQASALARFPHSARIVLTMALVAILVVVGLLLLERSGPSPVQPLGRTVAISRSHVATSAQLSSTADPTPQCDNRDDDGDSDDFLYNLAASIIPLNFPFRNLILSILDTDHDACRTPSGS